MAKHHAIIERCRLVVRVAWSHLMGAGGTLSQRVVRASSWVFVSYGVQQALSLVRSVILARLLSPSDFGLMGLASLSTAALLVFTQTGVWAALIQRRELDETILDTAWLITVARGWLVGLLIVLLAPIAASFFDAPLLSPILRVMALTFILSGMNSLSLVLLEREMSFRTLTYFNLITASINLAVAVTFGFVYRSVWALVVGELAGSLCALGLSYVIHSFRPRFRFVRRDAGQLLGFGKYVTASGIVAYVSGQGDHAYLGKALGTEPLGFYDLAYRLSNLPANTISQLLSRVTLPAYSSLQHDLPRLSRLYLQTLRVTALLAVPMAGGMFVLARYFVGVLYGSTWLPIVPSFMVLCFFGLERSIGSLAGSVFMALGKPQIAFKLVLAKIVAMAVAIVPLTSRYGILGTSIAVTLSAVVVQSLVIPVTMKYLHLSLRDVIEQLAPPALGTLLMMGVIWGLLHLFAWPLNLVSLLALVLAGGAVYTASVLPTQRELLSKLKLVLLGEAAPPEQTT